MDFMKGQNLVKADGSSQSADSALKGKDVILFYFSAHWCPPCRGFTPILKDFYEVRISIYLGTYRVILKQQVFFLKVAQL